MTHNRNWNITTVTSIVTIAVATAAVFTTIINKTQNLITIALEKQGIEISTSFYISMTALNITGLITAIATSHFASKLFFKIRTRLKLRNDFKNAKHKQL